MKTGLLGFLLACAGAYSAYIANNHSDDVRANEFAKYIHSQIDSMATDSLTEKEIDSYIRSYKKNRLDSLNCILPIWRFRNTPPVALPPSSSRCSIFFIASLNSSLRPAFESIS